MATLRSFPVVVEVWGWDEAFVGAGTDDPEALARAVQQRVLAETGLSCAVGHRRDQAAGQDGDRVRQAGGVARLTRRTWIETMGDRPVTALWGIGERTAQRLADAGIRTVVELAGRITTSWRSGSAPTIGPPPAGARPRRRRRHPWSTSRTWPASRSREETFEHDLTTGPRSRSRSPGWRSRRRRRWWPRGGG